ncbi:ABC transporter [Microbacterium paraoxydans]|uniref:ABC transporter n=1 Tax=Microbacterium paraoxydans TaxID=199592 RepID=UPI002285E02E|nr:ABC transporter [Microbacterium paraoxydans]MCZ0709162.1 ABC transporter [Microbacterium paraoxydans]
MRSRLLPLITLAALSLALTSCAGPAAQSPAAPSTPADGHGAIAGAEEVAEPQLGLTTVDDAGRVTHLDLLDESVTDIGAVAAPEGMATDGRYLFADTGDGVEVVDSGVWTWDHVDHFHYYRAEPALLGTVEGDGTATVATTNSSTTGGTGISFSGSGDAVLLDTEALSKGEIRELFRIERTPHEGLVVPVGSFALVTEDDGEAGGSVVGHTAHGERTGLRESCVAPSGTITTRVGAVIGCADGALLAQVEDGAVVVDRIPYPEDAPAGAVTSFHNREGRPTVAGLAGPTDIRILDTRARAWTLLTAPAPLVQVTAVGDEDDTLLALAEDGRVLVLSALDGAVRAETAPLVAESVAGGATPVLIADQHRAYLSGPAEHRLFEIDYADGARVARTFDTTDAPAFVAETGR